MYMKKVQYGKHCKEGTKNMTFRGPSIVIYSYSKSQ